MRCANVPQQPTDQTEGNELFPLDDMIAEKMQVVEYRCGDARGEKEKVHA